ncbi:hypothetical protein L873DRAFT_1763738 [Choiromyces venosus 120613-1]|uniref:DDE Tnp4 domain-containing protein n=1 Tax=Choiromyces venosus 120613-1 TaxID=1336337 RepID=A0A3N4JT51_9PEZI|nr:hypothetical protein L873DRAFT_1763738 [Choiromyces venosus 120613-1]
MPPQDELANKLTRFIKADIISLSLKLGLDFIEYPLQLKPSSILSLCILLAQLSSPTHYKGTLYFFGCSCAYQGIVFNTVIQLLYQRFKDILCLSYETIKSFSQSIERVGGPRRIWGFVDGTLHPIYRLEEDQDQFYTGYTQCHTIKFQGITTPDGLIASLVGLFEGKLGDWMA